MGSIARVSCHYISDLLSYIKLINKPAYKAEINGASIYKINWGTGLIFSEANHMEFQRDNTKIKNT